MQYTVISADTIAALNTRVNEFLLKGWELSGGVCVCYVPVYLGRPEKILYSQALTNKPQRSS